MLSRIHVAVATDGSGNVTLTPSGTVAAGRLAWLEAVEVVVGTLPNTTDITFTDHETGLLLLTLTNIAASGLYLPRLPAQDATGTAISGRTDRAPIAAGIDVAVAQAGNSHAGDVYLWFDQGAQS